MNEKTIEVLDACKQAYIAAAEKRIPEGQHITVYFEKMEGEPFTVYGNLVPEDYYNEGSDYIIISEYCVDNSYFSDSVLGGLSTNEKIELLRHYMTAEEEEKFNEFNGTAEEKYEFLEDETDCIDKLENELILESWKDELVQLEPQIIEQLNA